MLLVMKHFILSVVVMSLCAIAASAAPVSYRLDPEASRVGFEVPFGPDIITGDLPVLTSDIALDFQNPANSRVSVVLDVTRARANFPFASQALKGPRVLAAETFSTISFVSTGIEVIPGEVSKALLNGNISIRGVTRPLTLNVALFRPAGRDAFDRERLIVRISGAVSRAAFGATGWSDLVGDTVALDMDLQIHREN